MNGGAKETTTTNYPYILFNQFPEQLRRSKPATMMDTRRAVPGSGVAMASFRSSSSICVTGLQLADRQ
jgi:hypothetical protein